MSANINSVVLAGFGGLLPTTAQLAASFAAQPEQPLPHWHILYGIALFFLIGAVLGFAFNKESDLAKAVVIGISAPALITNILNGASAGANKVPQQIPPKVIELRPPERSSWWPGLVTFALAQTPQPSASTNSPAGHKSIVLSTSYAGQSRPDNNNSLAIVAIGTNGQRTSLGFFSPSQFAVLPVPDDTAKLSITAGDSLNRELELWPDGKGPPSFVVNVRLLGRATATGDLLWSLGADRKASIVDADITKVPLAAYAPPTTTDQGARSCGDEKTLTSLPGSGTAQVTFTNSADALRNVYWINYAGQRVFYQALQPGQHYVQPTFINHPWVITDSGGACKAALITQQPSVDFLIKN
ncbi:hypothetical protein CO669_13955 [Bradyrhizobium sp. Y36]|uniref:VHL beta domain-containing protein n=1 Tax=Bradyrhizobium sp. Y36 TaxID=2035447 RepID=UPI000BE92804|nr:hypothetical protein [Bradyrhizobium sp. Y36]PDT89885.1 hypothetical protein CO669_13955 [Bradyrhizobium sp. Y36]